MRNFVRYTEKSGALDSKGFPKAQFVNVKLMAMRPKGL